MANIFGRQVVIPLTNKSGGGVIAGDVVIIDTANDGAFTTTTTGAYQGSVGVAQETIANNATGRVLVSGYAALVNVPASVTRGHYVKTHTVVKQATGASSRAAGSFGQFLTGGTTPTAWLWGFPDNAGASGETVATSTIWDAAGDLVQGTGADTGAKLSAGTAGYFLKANGAAAALTWAQPPGYELDYVQITSSVTVNQDVEASATTVVTGSAVSYDGSTVVLIEFFAPTALPAATAADSLNIWLYDGSSSIGLLGQVTNNAGATVRNPIRLSRRLTPSNASHTYSIRATVTAAARTGSVVAGAAGSGAYVPAYIRITKV